MNISEFIRAYQSGAIRKDAAWRMYDFEKRISKNTAHKALKKLGYGGQEYSMAIAAFTADYNLRNPAAILSMWWNWHRVATGQVSKFPLRQ